jgi:uncharacterized protein YcfJ
MIKTRPILFSLTLTLTMMAAIAAAPLARANPAAAGAPSGSQPITPVPHERTLADNVVVTPAGTQPAPVQPVQPVQPVVTQPVQAVPAAPAPLVEEPRHRTVVHEEVTEPHNYVGTIAFSALMGGVTGALIGGAVYFLDNQTHPVNVAYWAAGGVLLGTGVGIVQVAVQETRTSQAMSLDRLPSDPVPTYRLALYKTRF